MIHQIDKHRAFSLITAPGFWSTLLIVVSACFVEMAPRIGIVDTFNLVPISDMVIRAGGLMKNREFLTNDFLPSLLSIGASFALAAVVGVLVGFIVWSSPVVRRALDPWLATYYAIPTFALYPLLVVVMGIGLTPIVLLGTLFAVVAVITSTVDGLDAIPQSITRLMQSLQLSRRTRMTKVLLPAAVPHLSVGLRLALSYSIIMVLASEFVLSTRGIGHFISVSYNDFKIQDMYAGVLIVFVLAAVLTTFFGRLLERQVDRVS